MKNCLVAVMLLTCVPRISAADPPAAPSPSTDSTPQQRAEAAAQKAYEAYSHGDYREALTLYDESYRTYPTPEVLFNIANIYDRKIGDEKLAIEFYSRHNQSPDATPDLVARAQARIKALESAEQSRRADARAPLPSTAPVRDKSARGKGDAGGAFRGAGVLTGSLGIVGVGIGAGFGLSASSLHAKAQDNGCSGKHCATQTGVDEEHSAWRAATVSTIAFVAGGILFTGGLMLVLLAPSSAESTAPVQSVRIEPVVGSGAAGLALTGVLF
jgi:hypothetical protein